MPGANSAEINDLRRALESVSSDIAPCTDSRTREFFDTFPLDIVFRTLQGDIDDDFASIVSDALDKLFITEYGRTLLVSSSPYAIAALDASAAALRRLGCRQLGHIVQLAPPDGRGPLLNALLNALEDVDTGVALEAEKGLLAFGKDDPGLDALLADEQKERLQQLVQSTDPIVRMRVFSLLVKLASTSRGHASTIERSGLLQPFLEEVGRGNDLLASMNVLELVSELAEAGPHSSRAGLAVSVMPILTGILGSRDFNLQAQALRVAAVVLRASKELGEDDMDVEVAHANGHVMEPLLQELKEILSVSGRREVSRELEEAALNSVGELGSSSMGATLLLEDPSHVLTDVAEIALGRAGDRERRVSALHALGSVGGVERGSRRRALLRPDVEDLFMAAILGPINSAQTYRTLPEVVLGLLSEPWPELRIASYRFLVALCLRAWGASEVCQYPELLLHILDPGSEVGRETSEWRYAAVQALAATVAQEPSTAALAAAASDIERSARLGVYGSGNGGNWRDIVTRAGQ